MTDIQAKRPEHEGSAALTARRPRATVAEDVLLPSAWLVLALLMEQPSHGYEISQRYQRRFASFMPMSVPRVYGALERLRDAGFIEPIAHGRSKSTSKQERMRRSYRPTEHGAQAYRRWLGEQMRDDPRRPQLLGRIVSAGLLGVDVLLDVIDRYQRECMQELAALPAPGERLDSSRASLEELTQSLVLDQQRRELRARNDWATYARQVLEAHAKAAPAQGSEHSGGRA
jgi:DNA-binding PadR family transcriptional regulator